MVETMCGEVYLIRQKKIFSKIVNKMTKHLIFPICFCQRETVFNFFLKFDQFEIDF